MSESDLSIKFWKWTMGAIGSTLKLNLLTRRWESLVSRGTSEVPKIQMPWDSSPWQSNGVIHDHSVYRSFKPPNMSSSLLSTSWITSWFWYKNTCLFSVHRERYVLVLLYTRSTLWIPFTTLWTQLLWPIAMNIFSIYRRVTYPWHLFSSFWHSLKLIISWCSLQAIVN